MVDDQRPNLQLTEEEKAENEALLGLFSHPGWRIYQIAAEETLFTLMQSYFSMNLRETIPSVNGRPIQRFKSMEQMAIEQSYLRGRIDQMRDLLYGIQEQPMQTTEQIDNFRAKIWETTKALFRRICWSV